jgi:hypothetical protein
MIILIMTRFPDCSQTFPECRLGRPVYIEKTGRIDPEMIKAKLSKEDVIRGHLWMMEYQNRVLMKQASVKTGRTVCTHELLLHNLRY